MVPAYRQPVMVVPHFTYLISSQAQQGTRIHASLPIPVAHRAPARAAALLQRAGSL